MAKKVHPLLVRMPMELFGESQALHFKHQMSLNLLITEMVRYAYKNPTFLNFLNNTYPPDTRRGHFVYIKDGRG